MAIGEMMVNETISLAGSDSWFGDFSSQGTPQFALTSGAAVNVNAANPGVYVTGRATAFGAWKLWIRRRTAARWWSRITPHPRISTT